MDKETYINTARNPASWLERSLVQKKVADQILDGMLTKENIDDSDFFIQLWINAHYHYGIAIENGLKGLIIINDPESVDIVESQGDKVRLKSIGKQNKLSHDLVKLADEAGVFERKIYQQGADTRYIKMVLSHLTDAIKWAPKYPVPSDNKSVFVFDGSAPTTLIFGFHMLDMIAPLFGWFEGELKQLKSLP